MINMYPKKKQYKRNQTEAQLKSGNANRSQSQISDRKTGFNRRTH